MHQVTYQVAELPTEANTELGVGGCVSLETAGHRVEMAHLSDGTSLQHIEKLLLIMYIELLVDVGQMRIHRSLRDVELLADTWC